MMLRLECTAGTSRKFYSMHVAGRILHASWGKIGTRRPWSKSWRCRNEEMAAKRMRRKALRELVKGYVLVDGELEGQPPALLHGYKWRGREDLRGWLLSEKYDGFRAFWDGAALWSKHGNVLQAPLWWLSDLPATPMDCELFHSRAGGWAAVASIVRGGDPDRWSELRLMAFDTPSPKPFERRVQRLDFITAGCRFVEVVEHFWAEGNATTRLVLQEITDDGGEGLVARDPAAAYEPGRHRSVLKLKMKYLEGA